MHSSASTEMSDYLATPRIVLMGCRPLSPTIPPDRPCPVCGGKVVDVPSPTYCGQCDALSPAGERRVIGARVGSAVRDRIRQARTDADAIVDRMTAEAKRSPAVLSEVERRRIWNGYRGGFHAELAEVLDGALAAEGRKFLRSIDQAPDFSIELDGRGNPVRFAGDVAGV